MLEDIEKDSQFLKLQGRKYPVTLCEGRKPRLLQKGWVISNFPQIKGLQKDFSVICHSRISCHSFTEL